MKNRIKYQWIGIQHVTAINQLAICLTHEIIERKGRYKMKWALAS